MHRKEFYGRWAGNERGQRADLSKCCEEVYSHGSHISSQCARKNGHGPDGAYCKQHDPAAVAARRAASQYKYDLQNYNARMRRLSALLPVVQSIAQGHNDPRALCQSWLDENAKTLTPPIKPHNSEEGVYDV